MEQFVFLFLGFFYLCLMGLFLATMFSATFLVRFLLSVSHVPCLVCFSSVYLVTTTVFDLSWIMLKTSLLVALSAFLQIFDLNLLPLLSHILYSSCFYILML